MNPGLSDLRPGQCAVLAGGCSADLLRLGLRPGTELRCLRQCPLGGPGLYRFRGAVYALRRRDAAALRVELRPAAGQASV